MLFITTWARKRPSHEGAPIDKTLAGSLPLPISASLTPPTAGFAGGHGFTPRSPKTKRHHNLSNARPSHRRAKMAKLAQGKTLQASTIPIRGLGLSTSTPVPTTPTAGRMAASAPATSAGILSPSTVASPGAMTRMSGSLRPRQTTARMLINAAQQQQKQPNQPDRLDRDRIRKERSGSLTPGPPLIPVAEGGKRVKV